MLDQFVLQDGALAWLHPSLVEFDLSFLSFILFIATIATMVQLVEIIVEKFSPSLYNSLGIFLPLIAVNCAILGGSLFMQSREIASIQLATTYGIGSVISVTVNFNEAVTSNNTLELPFGLTSNITFAPNFSTSSIYLENCILSPSPCSA